MGTVKLINDVGSRAVPTSGEESLLFHPRQSRRPDRRRKGRTANQSLANIQRSETNFVHVWLLTPRKACPYIPRMTKSEYLTEYDKIVQTMQNYIDGSRQGKSAIMRPAFHPDASFFGYAGEQLAVGTKFLFDWIDQNGPAPNIEPRIVSVDILDSIAVVRLEVSGWSGNLAGSGVRMSDLFTLLQTSSGWKVIQKAFHWHAAERSQAA